MSSDWPQKLVLSQTNILYISVLDAGSTTYKFSIVDVSDPTTPTLLNTVATTDDNSFSLTIQGNYLYAPETGPYTTIIYDITDPTTPVELDRTNINNGTSNGTSLLVQGKYAYQVIAANGFNEGGSIAVFNISDPTDIVQIGSIAITTPEEGYFRFPTPMVQGKYLYGFGRTQAMPGLELFRFELPYTELVNCSLNYADIGESVVNKLEVKNLNVTNILNSSVPASFSSVGNSGISTLATMSSTNNPLFTTSSRRTGSFAMADGTGPVTLGDGTDLLFTGQKTFVLEAYVEVSAGTDLWSHYRFVGVNESLVGDAWTMTVTRDGVTDPGITFGITAAGQVQYTTPTFVATFVHAHIYYEITSII